MWLTASWVGSAGLKKYLFFIWIMSRKPIWGEKVELLKTLKRVEKYNSRHWILSSDGFLLAAQKLAFDSGPAFGVRNSFSKFKYEILIWLNVRIKFTTKNFFLQKLTKRQKPHSEPHGEIRGGLGSNDPMMRSGGRHMVSGHRIWWRHIMSLCIWWRHIMSLYMLTTHHVTAYGDDV